MKQSSGCDDFMRKLANVILSFSVVFGTEYCHTEKEKYFCMIPVTVLFLMCKLKSYSSNPEKTLVCFLRARELGNFSQSCSVTSEICHTVIAFFLIYPFRLLFLN